MGFFSLAQEEIEAKTKEEIEKEKESPDWSEDKYEDPVKMLYLDFKVNWFDTLLRNQIQRTLSVYAR